MAVDGRRAWREMWTSGPWLTEVDRPAVTRFCELVDEIGQYRKALSEHGPVMSEPIVTPTGKVVGNRLVANPAARMLKDATAGLTVLANALGVTPASRARLGLVVAQARTLASQWNGGDPA